MSRPGHASHNPHPYRRELALRLLAAVVGGFVLANAVAVILASLLPMSTSNAVMTSLLLSVAIYMASALWVFSVKTVHGAWLGLTVPGVVLGTIAVLLKLAPVAG